MDWWKNDNVSHDFEAAASKIHYGAPTFVVDSIFAKSSLKLYNIIFMAWDWAYNFCDVPATQVL